MKENGLRFNLKKSIFVEEKELRLHRKSSLWKGLHLRTLLCRHQFFFLFKCAACKVSILCSHSLAYLKILSLWKCVDIWVMCFGPCLSSFLFFCYAGANLNFKTNGKQFLWVIWFDEKFTFKVNRECSKFISVVTSPMGKLREVHNGSCLFYVFFSSSFSGNGMYSTVLYFIFHFSSPQNLGYLPNLPVTKITWLKAGLPIFTHQCTQTRKGKCYLHYHLIHVF